MAKRKARTSDERMLEMRSSNHHITESSLAWLCDDIRRNGLPEASSRGTIYRARKAAMRKKTKNGMLVLDFDVGVEVVAVQDPVSMVITSYNESPAFKELVDYTHSHTPSSYDRPWSIIPYCDEVGFSPLKHDRRKLQGLYWSIMQFGAMVLTMEDAWFVVMAIRSDLTNQLVGSTSYLWKRILKELFFNQGGKVASVQLGEHLVFIEMGFFVADIPALKDVFKSSGHSGKKLCHFLANVVAHKSFGIRRRDAFNVVSTCLDMSKFRYHTDASIRGILLDLQNASHAVSCGRMTKTAYEKMCTEYGFSHCSENILLDDDLQIGAATQCMYDWMHIYLVGGLWNHEMVNLLVFLKVFQIVWKDLDAFVCQWTFTMNSSQCRAVFSTCGSRPSEKADHISCSASEGLSVYPVVRVFLMCLPDDRCKLQVESMMALCRVLDILQLIKTGRVTDAELAFAVLDHLRKYQAAYGTVGWLPKHLYSLLLIRQFEAFGSLVSLWTLERRHRLVKRFAAHHKNTRAYEKSLMEEVTVQHLMDLKRRPSFFKAGLVDPRSCTDTVQRTIRHEFGVCADNQSKQAISVYRTFDAGQVCCFKETGEPSYRVGQLQFHVTINGVAMTCIEEWTILERDTFVVNLQVENKTLMIETHCLIAPCVFRRCGDAVTLIVPCDLLR